MTLQSVLEIDAVDEASPARTLVALALAETGRQQVGALVEQLGLSRYAVNQAVHHFADEDLVRTERESTPGRGADPLVAVPINKLAPANHTDADGDVRQQVIEALACAHYEHAVSTKSVRQLGRVVDASPQKIATELKKLRDDGRVVQYGTDVGTKRWALADPSEVAPYRVTPTEGSE